MYAQSSRRRRMLRSGRTASAPARITAAAKLRLAEERLSAVVGQAASLQESHPVGIISIRDLLLTMTANQVVPLLDWLNEERRTLIERGRVFGGEGHRHLWEGFKPEVSFEFGAFKHHLTIILVRPSGSRGFLARGA